LTADDSPVPANGNEEAPLNQLAMLLLGSATSRNGGTVLATGTSGVF
jgi:hypothetical protein